MKRLALLVVALSVIPALANAAGQRQSSGDVSVGGYTKANGTYVEPYYRSAPNANNWDNYNYKPSQPQYNPSYSQPNANTTPNPGRLNDNNPYNDAPGSGGYNYYGR